MVEYLGRIVVGVSLVLAVLAPAFANPATPGKPVARPPAAAFSAAEMTDWCRRLTTPLPGIRTADCLRAELAPAAIRSNKGFPLLARKYGKAADARGKTTRILLIGGIHGDELTASAIVFQWLKFMPQDEAQRFEWMVVPVMNPDGLLSAPPRRTNANGVDLNRNFPTPGWEHDAQAYWIKRTKSDPRRFPGKRALSEPESRWLDEEMARFQPHVIISVHAPFGVLDFDGPAEPPKRFGRLVFNRVGVYPGSLGNYSGMHKNVPIITIELPNARAMPPPAEIKRIWDDMLTWIRLNVSPEKLAARNAERSGTTMR